MVSTRTMIRRTAFALALAALAGACGADTPTQPEPSEDDAEAARLVLGLAWGPHRWMGELDGLQVVRQVWLPDAWVGLSPTTWYLEGGTLVAPTTELPDGGAFRIWELEVEPEGERRPTAYTGPFAPLQWGADGSLLHLGNEVGLGPLVRIVDARAATVQYQLATGMPGSLNDNLVANADGTRAFVVGPAQGWIAIGALQEEGWALVGSLGPGLDRFRSARLFLGSRRGAIARAAATHRLELDWIDLDGPDLPIGSAATYPVQLDYAHVDPDDEAVLLFGEPADALRTYAWCMWQPASGGFTDLAHLDLSTTVTLLPSPHGIRIVDGALTVEDGTAWLRVYDVDEEGTILAEGRIELEPPPPSSFTERTNAIAPVRTGADPWGDEAHAP